MEYLFDPKHVAEQQRNFPSSRQCSALDREGESEWFLGMRKSARQIYRVLGNTHYAHLVELLAALELCLARGFSQPSLLRTRGRDKFDSDVAELRVAEHFALLGVEIAGFDGDKDEEAVPDVGVTTASGLVVSVEVFRPVQWEHAERLLETLQDVAKNIDLPWDYRFCLALKQLRVVDEQGGLIVSHPGQLETQLAGGRGIELARSVGEAFGAMLDDPKEPFEVAHEDATSNLRISVALSDLAYTRDVLPARAGCISPPSQSGYVPQALFGRLLEKGAAKAARGQALKVAADHAVLIVDVGGSDLGSELVEPVYRRAFAEMYATSAVAARGAYSAMLYVDTRGWGRPFVPLFASYGEGVPEEVVSLLEAGRNAVWPTH